MNLIDKLKTVSESTESLSRFLKVNIDDIFNFVINKKQSYLVSIKDEINDYFANSFNIIKELDFSVSENQMYLDLLLDLSERLNISFYFLRFISLKRRKNLNITKRNYATSLYINRLRSFEQYDNLINEILENLEWAFLNEEDNDIRVLFVFFNLYAHVIDTFIANNEIEVSHFISKIKILKRNYSFLSNSIVDEVLEVNIKNKTNEIYELIHEKIDEHFLRKEFKYNGEGLLIEINSEYAISLAMIEKNIFKIRDLASSFYNGDNNVFNSLGRGVTILSEKQQLYAYLHSYGKMHFAKCNYAFSFFKEDFFNHNIELIDWGCGQALATMSYLDFLHKRKINQIIKKINLNEPSKIALKRGSLHVSKYNNEINISTINKDLDSINTIDFDKFNNVEVKLHLFSNILDIDDYSTKKLSHLIKNSFNGLNYFVVVSPFITDLKTNRIDNFISEFKNLPKFNLIESENKRKGEWDIYNCSLVFRFFKVSLS